MLWYKMDSRCNEVENNTILNARRKEDYEIFIQTMNSEKTSLTGELLSVFPEFFGEKISKDIASALYYIRKSLFSRG